MESNKPPFSPEEKSHHGTIRKDQPIVWVVTPQGIPEPKNPSSAASPEAAAARYTQGVFWLHGGISGSVLPWLMPIFSTKYGE